MSLPQVLFTYRSTGCGGKFFPFAPLIPYLWYIARAAHLIIQIQMNSCLSKQLLLSNWITDEEDSLLPGNFGTTCTLKIWVLFYCNPQGGWGGQSFLSIPCVSALAVTCQNCFPNFTDFYWQFCSILCSKLGVFIILFFAVVYYSLSDIEPL